MDRNYTLSKLCFYRYHSAFQIQHFGAVPELSPKCLCGCVEAIRSRPVLATRDQSIPCIMYVIFPGKLSPPSFSYRNKGRTRRLETCGTSTHSQRLMDREVSMIDKYCAVFDGVNGTSNVI